MSRSTTYSPRAAAAAAGFTLLETLLALAIVSSVVTASLGLIPLGLRTAHEAERGAAEARILQHVSAHASTPIAAAFAVSESGSDAESRTLHFSANGSPLAANAGDSAYTCTVDFRAKTGPAITLPGNPDRSLRTVTIEIKDQNSGILHSHTLVLPPSP
jgi:uncharacterized protein (TIGR02598 family)